MEERNYTVYMHVCKENGKTYVGITRINAKRRWGGNGYRYQGQIFYRAIQKYGWDNFEHIILFKNKTKEEAEELEKLYIKVLLSNNREFGYNIDNGGNSIGKMTEETKVKISQSKIGKKLSERAKLSMKEKRKKYIPATSKKVHCDGKIFINAKECADFYRLNVKVLRNWLSGRNGMPKEFYDKGLKYLNSEYKTKPQIDLTGENNPNLKKVMCNGIIYNGLKEFAKEYKMNTPTVSPWLNGKKPMPQYFIDLGLRYLDSDITLQAQKGLKGENNPISKKVICDGIIFMCIRECAEFYGIQKRLLNDWLLHQHRMPQKYKDAGLSYYNE